VGRGAPAPTLDPLVGELGTDLSPSNFRRFWDFHEFGDLNEKGPSSAFCSMISEESGLNFHEL
jgi:hypothetical protein